MCASEAGGSDTGRPRWTNSIGPNRSRAGVAGVEKRRKGTQVTEAALGAGGSSSGQVRAECGQWWDGGAGETGQAWPTEGPDAKLGTQEQFKHILHAHQTCDDGDVIAVV